MSYSVANLKDSLSGMLQGLSMNNVKNLNIALERTARQVCNKLDIPEATGRQNLTLYSGVIDYPAPTDIFGSAIVDIQPQGMTRNITDYVYKRPLEQFDRQKSYVSNGYEMTFEYRKGVAIERIVSTRPVPKIELDPMTDDTGWTAAGSASSLVDDETVYWQTPASLRFTLTGASTGTLTKAIQSQDLTDYIGVGVVFLAFRTPSSSDLTSIAIRLGSDSTNYYSVSNTTGFLGAWIANEWTLIALDLSGASTTGTPTVTAIDYAQVRVTHGATITNFYTGGLWISLPSPHTVIYQTNAIFQASGANPSQSIGTAADTVLLNDSAYAIYEIECAIEIAGQQGGTLANGVIQTLREKLNGSDKGVGLYAMYRADNPSQQLSVIGSYYDD